MKKRDAGASQGSSQSRRISRESQHRRIFFIGQVAQGKHQQLGIGGKAGGSRNRPSHPTGKPEAQPQLNHVEGRFDIAAHLVQVQFFREYKR